MANNESTRKKFCSFCGQQLKVTAKFCSGCGRAVIDDNNGKNVDPNDDFIEVDEMFDELEEESTQANDRNKSASRNVSHDIDDFELRYSKAKNDDVKIAVIDSFMLPRDSTEMMQLVALCAENISKTGSNSYEVETAWMGKLDQAYQRARLTMGNDPLFGEIEAVYLEKSQEYATKNGKARKVSSWVKKHKDGVAIAGCICGLLLLSVMGFVIGFSGESKSKKKFDNAVDKITQEIEEGKLEAAYNDALRLDPSGNDQRKTRQNLLERIAQLRGSVDGKSFLPILSEGMDYKDAITKLEQAGFTDVSAEPAAKKTGLDKAAQKLDEWAGEIKDGGVVEISVNGDIEYLDGLNHNGATTLMGTYVSPDAKIVVRYFEK